MLAAGRELSPCQRNAGSKRSVGSLEANAGEH